MPPTLLRAFDEASALTAGSAKVRLEPPLPLVRPSGRLPRVVAEREQVPLEIRAVVLRSGGKTLAIVLADLMVISDQLEQALDARLADLHLAGLVFVATHTHGSVGGFDSRLVARVFLGPYRPDVVNAILEHAEKAVRQALRPMVRVHARAAQTRIPGWARNRSRPNAPVDDALTVVALEDDQGSRVATLAVVAGHPTLFSQALPELSADYPGVTMRLLEGGAGGVALLLQGAEGDAVPPGGSYEGIQATGALVAQRTLEAIASASPVGDRLAFAEVEFGLPNVDMRPIRPFLLRRPASNVLAWTFPPKARVTAVGIGDVMLLTVPGEPTELAGREIMAALPATALAGKRVRIVALAQGYVSYVDTPERVREGSGEARRAWYGADLMSEVTDALRAAVGGAREDGRSHVGEGSR
jgi:hypothetical protein